MSEYSDERFTSSGSGSEWPASFDSWPRERRIDYVSRFLKRADLLRRVLLLADVEPGTVGPSHSLNKSELAAIYLRLRGVAS